MCVGVMNNLCIAEFASMLEEHDGVDTQREYVGVLNNELAVCLCRDSDRVTNRCGTVVKSSMFKKMYKFSEHAHSLDVS